MPLLRSPSGCQWLATLMPISTDILFLSVNIDATFTYTFSLPVTSNIDVYFYSYSFSGWPHLSFFFLSSLEHRNVFIEYFGKKPVINKGLQSPPGSTTYGVTVMITLYLISRLTYLPSGFHIKDWVIITVTPTWYIQAEYAYAMFSSRTAEYVAEWQTPTNRETITIASWHDDTNNEYWSKAFHTFMPCYIRYINYSQHDIKRVVHSASSSSFTILTFPLAL